MRDKIYTVLDTNVLVSAWLGATHMSTSTNVRKAMMDERISPHHINTISGVDGLRNIT